MSLEIKFPQLSKPEETAARNQNSIGDRTEKKPWDKPGSVGGPVPFWPDEPAVCSNCSSVTNTKNKNKTEKRIRKFRTDNGLKCKSIAK